MNSGGTMLNSNRVAGAFLPQPHTTHHVGLHWADSCKLSGYQRYGNLADDFTKNLLFNTKLSYVFI